MDGKTDRKWRRTRCSDLLTFKVKKNEYATDLMIRSRREFYNNFISENSPDQKKLFFATKKVLNHTDEVPSPPFNDKLKFANEMGPYFIEKIANTQVKPDNIASGLSAPILTNCLRTRGCLTAKLGPYLAIRLVFVFKFTETTSGQWKGHR